MDKITAKQEIEKLVEKFKHDEKRFKSAHYNETEVRREFIDPFFTALGWNVADSKEIKHEDSAYITVEPGKRAKKHPDYGFYLDGTLRFYVEAKKPAVKLYQEQEPALQIRRYGWSSNLPIGVLTDFEELIVYNCQIRPNGSDSAAVGRVRSYKYTEYLEKFDEIFELLSKESVRKGSLFALVDKQRGTDTVDIAFLREIENWRELLAKNIALRNPTLTSRDLNQVVQNTIDRIIFLRIAEDRGIEQYGTIEALLNGRNLYHDLKRIFQSAHDKYNSGLFEFSDPDIGDQLAMSIVIDDKPLQEIIGNLYWPKSPYIFNVMPVDILGQVYERFLGKVIRLDNGTAVIEDRPEIRKAGGVYYTPVYVVNYIVKHAIEKLVDGKTPDEVAKLRILDPACGSGSFLLGAYHFLIRWHLDYYLAHPKHAAKKLRKHGHDWVLDILEKQRILLANIYGVDLDSQAVEVTKLSLLLKMLEGENAATAQSSMFRTTDKILPDLSQNIQWGNSLVESDFYDPRSAETFTEEELLRVKAFDYAADSNFGGIMREGGFDAVIGNPPYIRIQILRETSPEISDYYTSSKYQSARSGSFDIYILFIEKALRLLKSTGVMGYIVQHKFFTAQYGRALREMISEGKNLSQIVHFGAQQVFLGATTYTCLLFLDKTPHDRFDFIQVENLKSWAINPDSATQRSTINASDIAATSWNFSQENGAKELYRKVRGSNVPLQEFAQIFVGLQTSADDVFILDIVEEGDTFYKMASKSLGTEWILEKELFFPIVSGQDVNRYKPLPNRQYVLFPYRILDERASLIPYAELKQKYPQTATYLEANRTVLEAREKGKFKDDKWYRMGRSQNLGIQSRAKLCIPRLLDFLYVAYDQHGEHFLDNVDVCGISIKPEYNQHQIEYLMGLMNSRLLRWYFPSISTNFRGEFLSANKQFIGSVPIRMINFNSIEEATKHDEIVRLVSQMREYQAKFIGLHGQQAKIMAQRIDRVDHEIDALVYALYDLNQDERRFIQAT